MTRLNPDALTEKSLCAAVALVLSGSLELSRLCALWDAKDPPVVVSGRLRKQKQQLKEYCPDSPLAAARAEERQAPGGVEVPTFEFECSASLDAPHQEPLLKMQWLLLVGIVAGDAEAMLASSWEHCVAVQEEQNSGEALSTLCLL